MCPVSLAGVSNFNDGDFNPADWTTITNAGGTSTHLQVLAGGHPDAYLKITNHPTLNMTVSGFHMRSGFVYDPSTDGALTSIGFSFDHININSAQATGLAIEQGGNTFAAGVFVTSSNTWITTGTVTLLPGELNPAIDLSTTGSPVTLGIFTANTYDPSAGSIDYVVGYDNFSITINTEDIVPIPGDLNNDGFVGLDDLDIVLQNWNLNVPPADDRADPSGDGFVGLDDLDTVLNNWNAGTPPSEVSQNVPEPVSASLLATGTLALYRRSRRP